jgi:alanyl-tRNA synthetase
MTARELREKYLEFFKFKGHTIIPSASLVPSEVDPSVLFTTAGMHPLVPYLLGENHPGGKRVTNVQKCMRTGDIDEIGDTTHHTFFEMLGNWSFGDYFKKESLAWSWEFLTSPSWLNLDKNKIAVSVFAGDADARFDSEAYEIWKSLGVDENKIAKLPKENNWWGPAGAIGPCGPDSEIFYWSGKDIPPEKFDPEDVRWTEIWNNVFMQYNKTAENKFELLMQKNVDTGMGLERTLAVLNGLNDNYETDLFQSIIKKIQEISFKKYEQNQKSFRIIADHIKAATFILADGIKPLNVGHGYVLRRLIRRAIRHGKILGIEKDFLTQLSAVVIEVYQGFYPELTENRNIISAELKKEENKFRKTLEKGLREFNKISKTNISGMDAFNLYQNYGFPFEMTKELAMEKGLEIDEKKFQTELQKHQKLSRTASVGQFKGGLAEAGEQAVKLHTATHLLLAALRGILGSHVFQKGSNITAERLRLDFSHNAKMIPEELEKVQNLVNEAIKENVPVICREMPISRAKKDGAVGVFESKYGNKVNVYTVGKYSSEICGGPHVKATGELGHFKIVKEEASSAGVRRIKAILE